MPTESFVIKDIATLMLSGAALLTSVSVAVYNVRVQRAKKGDDARKSFEEAIQGISKVRQDLDALRHEAGEDFESQKYQFRRIVLGDTRNFFLAKALHALNVTSFLTSSVDNMLIAVALIDSGRHRASVPFYRKAVDTAADEFDRATALRVLGRAHILSGDFAEGRREMLIAASSFRILASDSGFDRHRMLRDEAETYRRLVAVQLIVDRRQHLQSDVARIAELCGHLSHTEKMRMEAFIADTRAELASREAVATSSS